MAKGPKDGATSTPEPRRPKPIAMETTKKWVDKRDGSFSHSDPKGVKLPPPKPKPKSDPPKKK